MKDLYNYLVLDENGIPHTHEMDDGGIIFPLYLKIGDAWGMQSEDEKIIKVVTQESIEIETLFDWHCPVCDKFVTALKEGLRAWCTECGMWHSADEKEPWLDLDTSLVTVIELIINRMKGEGKNQEEIDQILLHFNAKEAKKEENTIA